MTAPPFTVDVVSPQFPCGAAWLANALLELQVPLAHLWGFDTHEEWRVDAQGTSHYAADHLPWRQTLASLVPGRAFRFDTRIRPRFSHAFPWQFAWSPRLVFIVRDPRDALYSEWQRHRRNLALDPDLSFPDFLRTPFFGGPVSIVDMLWLHLRCWQALRAQQPERIYLLRFEDWKRDPVGELRAVTRWIGLQPDAAALSQAVGASDVQHLLAVEEALAAQAPHAPRYNRAGEAGEWRRRWQADWHAALGPQWGPVMASYGYALAGRDGDGPGPACGLAEALAWRGLADPLGTARWTAELAPEFGADSLAVG